MIVFVSTADTEILALSRVARDLPEGFPALKAVNPTRLPAELGPTELVSGAVMVLVRLLGGRRAWEEGFAALVRYCRQQGIPMLAWSGEQHVDAELTAASTAPAALVGEAFEYLRHGGVENVKPCDHLFCFLPNEITIVETSPGQHLVGPTIGGAKPLNIIELSDAEFGTGMNFESIEAPNPARRPLEDF